MEFIRELKIKDLADVSDVFLNSFSADEAPITFNVIRDLVVNQTQPSSLCLGYEEEHRVVGAVSFSPVYFCECVDISAYILAPLAVHNDYQNKGIAKKLVFDAFDILRDQKIDFVLVYGDPKYYCKYGFEAELGKHFIPPYPLSFEFGWQAKLLCKKKISEKYKFKCVEALSNGDLW